MMLHMFLNELSGKPYACEYTTIYDLYGRSHSKVIEICLKQAGRVEPQTWSRHYLSPATSRQ